MAADHLAVSLNFSMTTELLPIHLILLAKMPTYGYKSVFAQTATFIALNDIMTLLRAHRNLTVLLLFCQL